MEPDETSRAAPPVPTVRAVARVEVPRVVARAAVPPAVHKGGPDEIAPIRPAGGSEDVPMETPEPDEPTRPRTWPGRVLLPLVVAAAAAFVAATGYLAVTEPQPSREIGRWAGGAAQNPAQSPSAVISEGPFGAAQEPGANDRSKNPFAAAAPDLTGPPTRLRVPAIGVDTGLETLRIGADGELTAPVSFTDAGYYADGTLPGDAGPAVIAGHVDSQSGPAIFYRLREIVPGDRIEVVRGGKTVRFTVRSTAWYPKKDFPTERVYGPTPDRQLRLITCGGVFDRALRSYRDNLVVYAVAG